jgi:hypothetical protein
MKLTQDKPVVSEAHLLSLPDTLVLILLKLRLSSVIVIHANIILNINSIHFFVTRYETGNKNTNRKQKQNF